MPPPASKPRAEARPARAPRVHALGDAAALVVLGTRVDPGLNARAIALAAALQRGRGVLEAVAGYATVTVHFDPAVTGLQEIGRAVARLTRARPPAAPTGRLHRIPVIYDGPDLGEAADRLRLTTAQLIAAHTGHTYRVFMVGFVPGWAYLGPLPDALRLPRRSVPRTHVPAGSVAIAGAQTGVYPLPTPGGWHLLGRTEVPMFLPDADPPLLLRTGDRVRFFEA